MTPLSLLLLRSPLLSRLSWHLLFSLLFHFCLFFFSAVTANCWRWSRTSAWRLGNYWTVPPPSEALCLCVQVIESLLINGVIYHISIERRPAAPAWLHKDYFLQASLQWCCFFFFEYPSWQTQGGIHSGSRLWQPMFSNFFFHFEISKFISSVIQTSQYKHRICVSVCACVC